MKLKYLIVLLCVMTAFVTMSCSDDEEEFTWHEYKLPVSASELNCPIDEPVLVNDQAELTRIVGGVGKSNQGGFQQAHTADSEIDNILWYQKTKLRIELQRRAVHS